MGRIQTYRATLHAEWYPDMVSQFAFGKSLNALADPEFKSLPVRVFQQYLPSLHVIKAFPFVRWLNSLPSWIAKRVSHTVEMGHELEQVLLHLIYRR